MVNFKNLPSEETPVNAENLNNIQNDIKQLQNFYHIVGQLGGTTGMWWRIGKINKYFASLITLNVMAGGGYAESYNLNVSIIAPRGVVLEKIGASSICNGACFTKARIVYHATNVEDAYLELFTPGVRENVNLYITVHTAKQSPHNYSGFECLNANGTVPEGYLSKEIELVESFKSLANGFMYRKVGNDVEMSIYYTNNNSPYSMPASGNTTVGTIPEGYRPTRNNVLTPIFGRNIGTGAIYETLIEIRTDGQVRLVNGHGPACQVSQLHGFVKYSIL